MKKLLALLLVLVMCLGVFASCGTPEPTGATLEEAKDYLYNSMKDKNDKATPSDYTVVAKLIMNNTTFNVTWTTDNENIVVKEKNANFYTIDVPDANDTEVTYTLTATIKNEAGESIQVSFTRKLPVVSNVGIITDLKENVAYKIFFKQVDLGGLRYYATNTTQDNQNKYIETNLDAKEAADFYIENVDGGFKIYTTIGGVKNYVHATAVPKTGATGFTKSIGFATETDSVFNYDAERQTYYVEISGEKFGVGTYGTFDTLSISELVKYFKNDNIEVAKGQFPMRFYESAYAETLEPDKLPEHVHEYVDGYCSCGEKDPNATVTTQATVITAEILGLGAYADGTKALTDITLGFTELGTYGDGIQWRTKDGKSSSLWNTTATTKGITKIEITIAEGKYGYSNSDVLKMEFGNAANSLTYTTTLSTEANVAKYTITPDADTYTFFKFTHNYDYTLYIERITIYYEGADTPSNPDTPAQPEQPDTPTPEEPTDKPTSGTGYTVSGTNANGTIYLTGGVTSGRFDATLDQNAAAIFYFEDTATEGQFLIYFYNGTTKTYIVMGDSSTGGSTATDSSAATVFEWNDENNTPMVAEDSNSRGFGTSATSTYNNFSAYDMSSASNAGKYIYAQFTAVEGTEPEQPDTPAQPEQPDTPTPEEPKGEYGIIANPVAGTAYKFGMVQTNAGKTVYLKGGMSGFYMATTENIDEAIDVYLEATEGGYYLYTMSGDTKTYINMVVSGTHVNGAYEATASTVYTVDASRQSIVADIDGTPYHFGTRNDNTYLTVGPCKTSYNGFDCQFYGIIDADEPTEPDNPAQPEQPDTPVEPEQPDTPVEPEQPDTPVEPEEPANNTGYTVSATHNTNGVLYLDGTISSGRFNSTTDKAKAAIFYFEDTATEGQFLIYFYNGTTKTYLVFADKSAGGSTTTDATAATAFEWNETNSTPMVAEDANSRAFGIDPNGTYTTFSCYDITSATTASQYNWGQFTAVEA